MVDRPHSAMESAGRGRGVAGRGRAAWRRALRRRLKERGDLSLPRPSTDYILGIHETWVPMAPCHLARPLIQRTPDSPVTNIWSVQGERTTRPGRRRPQAGFVSLAAPGWWFSLVGSVRAATACDARGRCRVDGQRHRFPAQADGRPPKPPSQPFAPVLAASPLHGPGGIQGFLGRFACGLAGGRRGVVESNG